MTSVYLGLGSNIEPEHNLRIGIDALRQQFGDLDISPVYRSKALGFEGADFLNLVVGVQSAASASAIDAEIERIEKHAGRRPGDAKFSSRPLDIDLLLYGDLVGDAPRLPRPDVLDYSFVLRPLADIAPDTVHPVTGRRFADHWQEFDESRHPLTPVDVIL